MSDEIFSVFRKFYCFGSCLTNLKKAPPRKWKWDKEVARTKENNISSPGKGYEDAGQEKPQPIGSVALPCPLLCLVFDVNVSFFSCSGLVRYSEP